MIPHKLNQLSLFFHAMNAKSEEHWEYVGCSSIEVNICPR